MKCFKYNFQKMLLHVILNIEIYFLMTTLSLLKYVKKYLLKSKTLGLYFKILLMSLNTYWCINYVMYKVEWWFL